MRGQPQLRASKNRLTVFVEIPHNKSIQRFKKQYHTQLHWQPPGELGELLALDRIPEVKCLRNL